ncbi:histidine phosphatase family protein [Aeromonas sp. BIGb0445]|uniref:histidine phosphatase family protein n=1 Tax=Aeromonas sp. BIGb0445 TaxID=2940593 RepID=UPI00216A079D|nr:histidine phosphatase family protein [Aeromonas sp. BIGb0445]MCS3458249.1 putative phosphoglycerate mutase [Aeromonas sp. BIGb0445]
MTPTLYLLRHGQTRFNAQQRLQGHCNSPLTPLGEQQARAMGATLRQQLDDPASWTLYASPLGRAMQTARLVCDELGLGHGQIRVDERLKELGLGEWEERRLDEIRPLCFALESGEPDWYLQAPKGEGLASLQARCHDWLHDQSLGSRRIAVAHGLSGIMLRGLYAGLSHEALWQQALPQDAMFRLQGGEIARIPCQAALLPQI